MVCYHWTKFGGHKYYGSGDIIDLACHVILQDHMTKESCDYKSESPMYQITNLPSLVAIVVGEIAF